MSLAARPCVAYDLTVNSETASQLKRRHEGTVIFMEGDAWDRD